ncbi:MAG: energy-coupling factor ABC transporter ATP-binding protein [Oscillospiraceae bacterium]|nr:energy-coupling factor ABC transporter ATP-binding protein [Oscillospiraceae bacterium]
MRIDAENLSFAYPEAGFRLDGVSFYVESGESVAITGRNGSGKTTLGKLLCGLLKPQGGRVLFDGEDTSGWSLPRRGKRIGYLFQEPSKQLFAPAVMEELTFTQELMGTPADEAARRAYEVLSRFDLSKLASQGTYTLSRGEKQRLAICGLLLHSPEALVLDEPTTGLDKRRGELLAEAIRECLSGGVSVIMISHDREFVKNNASREIRLEDGKVV